MEIIESIAAMREARGRLVEPLGLVSTMGFLHQGHLSLVRRARAENSAVAVSIFVNPTQFGPGEDLGRYPRDIPRDTALLAQESADFVFIPEAAEMYPAGFATYVSVEGLAARLEGATRPGHFRGVATVCNKLFNIVRPARAYFGQKDAQQVLVIKRMVADLNMNLDIVTVPTVREPDGLAMSSRNVYLSLPERQAATVLHKALRLAEVAWQRGEQDVENIRVAMTRLIQNEPLAGIDYVSVADAETLAELQKVRPPALVSLAVRIGKTRLIDNLTLV
jgi:pantoate--beta-alanine ligase